jgi:hypothetical protein
VFRKSTRRVRQITTVSTCVIISTLVSDDNSLEDVHTALGYRYSCTTCFPRCPPTDSLDGVAMIEKTTGNVGTRAQDDWLQTFAHVEEIDSSTIVDSVLNGWDNQEFDNRVNSFFQISPPTRAADAFDKHSVAATPKMRFPYASQQLFNRIPVELPYESAIFTLVQCGDIEGTRALLTSGSTSIDAVDPYGLGLLYVSSRSKVPLADYLSVNTSMLLTIAGEATGL